MKAASIFIAIFVAGVLVFVAIHFLDDTIAPLFLNSRIERLGERNLPRIVVERGNVVYCRMNAGDFRFPLPSGSLATNLVVSGGFDTVDGSVEARFDRAGGLDGRRDHRRIKIHDFCVTASSGTQRLGILDTRRTPNDPAGWSRMDLTRDEEGI